MNDSDNQKDAPEDVTEDSIETPKEITEETTEDTTEEEVIAVGNVVHGTITNVTNFGAFIKLANGEEGLVHISEIAHQYVTDINEHVRVGESVQIKILARNDRGKFDLSMKKAVKKETPDPALFLNKKSKDPGFEDKLGHFMKRSEEKLIDVRRNLKNKQGITKKRK